MKVENFWCHISEKQVIRDRTYLSFILRADNKSKLYVRQDYELLTFFGDLGGLTDFVLIIGVTLSSVFVSRLIQAALI